MTRALAIALACFALLLGRPRASPTQFHRILWWVLVSSICLSFALQGAAFLRRGLASPPEWDFHAFWVWGRAGAQGLDFYRPEVLRIVARDLDASDDFRREVLDVGFSYPPFSILLFRPLGCASLRTAYVYWMGVNLATLVAALFLVWRFSKNDGRDLTGLGLVVALIALLGPTLWTIRFAQTNFALLAVLLMWWSGRDRFAGGMWLGLAALIKPVAALLALLPLVRGQVRNVYGIAVTLATATLVTLLAFGVTPFLSYLTDPPMSRLPPYVYTQRVNQSLLATILRLEGRDTLPIPPVSQPLFLSLATILAGATVFLVRRMPDEDDALAKSLTLCLALMVYPATLAHYGVLLVLPFLALLEWSYADDRMHAAVAAWVSLSTALLSQMDNSVFVAFALTWLAVAVAAARRARESATTPA